MAKRRSEVGGSPSKGELLGAIREAMLPGAKSVIDEIAAGVKASVAEGEKRRAEYDQMNKDLDKAWGGPDPKPYQRTPDEVEADAKNHARRFSKEEVESMRRSQGATSPYPVVELVGQIKLTVVWAEENFQPVQYNGFRVGPLSLEIHVQAGESIEAAYQVAWAMLDQLARKQFSEKLDAYLDRLQQMGERVEARKR